MCDEPGRRVFLSAGAWLLALPLAVQLAGCRSSERPEPDKKIFTDPKIELLDLALQHEFGAVVQYCNHAGVLGAIGQDVDGSTRNTIEQIIGQEVHHAVLLTEILKKYDVEPTVAVWPPQTAVTAEMMIEKNIATENGAIRLYEQLLTFGFDDQTKKTIELLLRSEETHLSIFRDMLPELS